MRSVVFVFGVLGALALSPAIASERSSPVDTSSFLEQLGSYQVAQARTCKAVSSCEEAVRLWCGGYSRADGDNDGIPCENVCSTRAQVEEIKEQIGC